jgi:hypothetical protein
MSRRKEMLFISVEYLERIFKAAKSGETVDEFVSRFGLEIVENPPPGSIIIAAPEARSEKAETRLKPCRGQ